MLVHRFDVAALGNAERTPQGFLKIPGFLTRTGVLEYRRADGTVVRELRPRDEVFKAQSLATLSAAPVTDLHPTEMVTPKNVRELAIGHVSDHVKADGELVAAHVTIQDENAIAAVERGDRRELSCGYQCRIDATPGVFGGQAYDQVQRDIVYNHVAIGPRNWGRAGRDVALRVDSAEVNGDVFRLDEADALSVAMVAPPDSRGDSMEPVTEKAFGALQARFDALQTEHDKTKAELEQAKAEQAKLKGELAAANDPKRLDAALNARVALVEAAKRVLPDDHKFDGQSPRQIQEAVLLHIDPSDKFDSMNDLEVASRFDQAMKMKTLADKSESNLDEARELTSPPSKRKARQDADDEPEVPDWMKPLSYHRAPTKTF